MKEITKVYLITFEDGTKKAFSTEDKRAEYIVKKNLTNAFDWYTEEIIINDED
jgi:hypothetical protein